MMEVIMRIHRSLYRTTDGAADYGFSFEEQADGTWRAYITQQPGYSGRDTDGHTTHRYSDRNGRKYVCWTGPLRNLKEAKLVAAAWADHTQHFIRTGIKF
jgi:hypothetical protein